MASGDTEEEMLEMMEDKTSDVTEYERARLERIKHNRDMLANLQVQEIATALEPVPKKPRAQNSKGKEKVDTVVSRRLTRLSTRTKTPTKIVDWSSGASDSEAPSESDSDGTFFSKGPAKKKGKAPKAVEEEELDESPKTKDDDEYEPSGASESDQEVEAEEPDDDEPLQRSQKKQEDKVGRSSGKKADHSGKFSFRLKAVSSPILSPKEGDTDGEDLDLEQAIQLSLQNHESKEVSSLNSPGVKGAGPSKQRKRKGGRDFKFTQDEIDAYFVSIAGSDVGAISLNLLENAAISYDFIWSEEELQDMIDVFDENDDGFLSLPEFRAMAARCKMMEAS